jgi:excisionase family DNA binding protein
MESVYTVAEVARKLGIGRTNVTRLIEAGEIKAKNIAKTEKNKYYRISETSLSEYLNQ